MSNSAYPVVCGFGAALCLISLPLHVKARNSSTLVLLGWVFTGCIVYMINSIIWAGNTNDSAPVWCDISSRFVLCLSVGIPAASLCVQRRLYRIARMKGGPLSSAEAKREVIVDLVIGVGLPLLMLPQYHIVQAFRYDIMENSGCWPAPFFTPLTLILGQLWPVIISCVSLVYSVLTIHEFMKRRRQFSRILSDSGSDFNLSRYFRLMALVSLDVMCTVPLSLYVLIEDARALPYTWASWEVMHENIDQVVITPEEMTRALPSMSRAFEIVRWSVPGCAVVFFAFFGLPREAKAIQQSFFWKFVSLIGFGPLVAKFSRHATSRTTQDERGTCPGGNTISAPVTENADGHKPHGDMSVPISSHDITRPDIESCV